MPLTLTIENEASLPDGGPLTLTVPERRSVEIGRDPSLDWVLPDPSRTISGRHCEVQFRDGGFWLHDVSRNGTFLNRSDRRIAEPHRLRDGDRIEIGRYIVAVRLDGDGGRPALVAGPAADAGPASGHGPAVGHGPMAGQAPGVASDDWWAPAGDAAPAIDRRALRPPSEMRPVQPDFRDWAVDVPPPLPAERAPERAAPVPQPLPADGQDAMGAMDWAASTPPNPPPEPPPIPAPRRPAAPAPPAETPPPADASAPADWSTPPAPAPANPWHTPSLVIRGRRPAEEPAAPPPVRPPEDAPVRAVPDAVPAGGPAPIPPGDFVARLAKGAGVPAELLAWRDPGDLAEEVGALLRLTSENLKQLLSARAEAKRAVRTGSHTTVQALDNNPLKFSPTLDDALRIMLGRPSSGYLDARRALDAGFKDVKAHQVKTYAAMQNALRLLTQDLDPEAIEEASGPDKGLAGLLGSRKAKLWDVYAARWDTLTAPHDDGIVDAYMMFFAECYDGGDRGR